MKISYRLFKQNTWMFVVTAFFAVLANFSASASSDNTSETSATFVGCSDPFVFNLPITTTGSTAVLTWPFNSGAGWYIFEYRVVGAGTWTSGGSAGGASTTKTLSGLTAATNYEVRGRTYCSGSPSSNAWSTPETFTTAALSGCELPPNLTAGALTGSTITLNWASVSGAGWYTFRYKESTSGTWLSAGSATSAATSKIFLGLNPNTSYDFEGRTHCPSGGITSAYFPITVSTPDVPSSSVLAGTASICTGMSTPLTVTITGGTSPYTVVINTGGAYTTVSSYVSGAPISVSPMTTSTYNIVSVTDNNGYVGVGNSGTPTVTVSAPSVPVTPGTATSAVQTFASGATVSFVQGCDIIGSLKDFTGGNVPGTGQVSTELLSTTAGPNVDGFIYGRRSYSGTLASDGPVRYTMYFTQDDFDDYNANNPGMLDLPTAGVNSDPNKVYFRIATVSTGGAYVISPAQGDSLTWNGSLWVLTTTVPLLNNKEFYFTTMPSCSGINVSGLNVTSVNPTYATASWTDVVTTPTFGWFSLQYRIVGAPTWTSGGTTNNGVISKVISGLTPNSDYEIQVRRHCSSQSAGDWSASVLFSTPVASGCALPPSLTAGATTATTVTVDWVAVSGAGWYQFRYKPSASATWITGSTAGAAAVSKTFVGLASSTAYDVQARTYCPNGIASAWSATANVTTGPSAIILNGDNTAKQDVAAKNIANPEMGVKVYPNPVVDQVTIELNVEEANANTAVKLIDMSGRVVREMNIATVEGINAFDMNLTNLNSGVYTLFIYTEGNLLMTSKVKKN